MTPPSSDPLLQMVDTLRVTLPGDLREQVVGDIFHEAEGLIARNQRQVGANRRHTFNQRLDGLLTSRWTGIPMMILIFSMVLWITIVGANVPSGFLATLLVDQGHDFLRALLASMHAPEWALGLFVDGMYLTLAWVVAVMLPPMAIFFPLFTILEDFGYLPRVAFNLDNSFRRAGAHGKQALSMAMGFGCNAAGVVSTRIIDSPRERLIAILTNNFALCNGRWPTQILIATLFLGALAPPAIAGLVSAAAVMGVTLLGVFLTFVTSWGLSRTLLKGEASTFSLELPPYRPPRILRTLYTSLIDRTLTVLWRAMVFAAPAGAVIWLVSNIPVGDASLAHWLVAHLEPMGWLLGLNGIIILAYIVAIPANEIVIPTILMLTVLITGVNGVGEQGAGVMFETDGQPLRLILEAGGWTTLTAICLMLFSLCHNPCSTTIYTIYKETRSLRWTTVATLMPLILGIAACSLLALIWRIF